MSKYTTEELGEVILQVANSLKLMAEGLDKQNNAIHELALAMDKMNHMVYSFISKDASCPE